MVMLCGLRGRRYQLPLAQAVPSGDGPIRLRGGWWIEATCATGVRGWGEVATWPQLGPPETALAAELGSYPFSEPATQIPIERPRDVFAWVARAVPAASSPVRFGLETALLDLWARCLGQPLWLAMARAHWPGTPGRGRARDCREQTLAVNALVADPPSAQQAVQRGYRVLKVKTTGAAPALEAERVRDIRAAAGDAVSLRIDAGGRWSPAAARDFLERVGVAAPAYVEDPCPPEPQTWRELAKCQVPLAVDAAVADAAMRRVTPIWVVKPMFDGGWSGVQSLAEHARHQGARLVLTSVLESRVGALAAAHLAACLGVVEACGLSCLGVPLGDADTPGRFAFPAGAGLGDAAAPDRCARAGESPAAGAEGVDDSGDAEA